MNQLFEVPPAEEVGGDDFVFSETSQWRTWDPDSPPVVIPPTRWFLESPPEGESDQDTIAEILERLAAQTEGGPDFSRGREDDRDEEESPYLQVDRSSVEEVSRDLLMPRDHARVSIENDFERLAVELRFVEIGGGSDAITVVLLPGDSEELTVPEGEYLPRRRVWNPMAEEHETFDEEFPSLRLRDRWRYEWPLRAVEEGRIERRLDRPFRSLRSREVP